MDQQTLDAYRLGASSYSNEWLEQPPPNDLYSLFTQFLRRGGKTADVGCGNGREVNWLTQNGYPSVGFDAVDELLQEARLLFPKNSFSKALLPDLTEISETYTNVVCETVIMHLHTTVIPQAIQNLTRILEKKGILYLSWRKTAQRDVRQTDGRLYSCFDSTIVLDALGALKQLYFDTSVSSSSGKVVCRYFGCK